MCYYFKRLVYIVEKNIYNYYYYLTNFIDLTYNYIKFVKSMYGVIKKKLLYFIHYKINY